MFNLLLTGEGLGNWVEGGGCRMGLRVLEFCSCQVAQVCNVQLVIKTLTTWVWHSGHPMWAARGAVLQQS